MARFMVEKAATTAKTPAELFAQIAASIPATEEREAFLSRKQEFLRIASPQAARVVAVGGGSSGSVTISPDGGDLNPDSIKKAAELAARYLGPLSQILAARAAQRANGLKGLYLILAEHLKEGEERTRFLRDAGYPDS
jgi:hypothetical protein